MKMFLALASSVFLIGCASGSDVSQVQQLPDSESGSLVIARPLPVQQDSTGNLFGFMPQRSKAAQAHRLVLDKESGTATILKGALKLASFPVANIEGLKAGTYEVIHKQRHPVWYATDSYFEKRALTVPTRNAKERYLKGALGDYVIYLDDKTPLHNSAVFADEVGGVRLQDNDIAQLYYKLSVGASIQVR